MVAMKNYQKQARRDKKPLWEYLNLGSNFSTSEIDFAYNCDETLSKRASFAWKLLRDKYFASEYVENLSTKRVFESGFFNDNLPLFYYDSLNYFWRKTPIYKITKNYNKGCARKYAVLLTTGAFSPMHKGHILFMEAAKKELEARGYVILGGYFSPSHNDYVRTKDGELIEPFLSKRIDSCRLAVKNSDWLMIDPWESKHVAHPITYTMVYDRLLKYVKYCFPNFKNVKIYFVVGSDNAAYARVFKKHGYCVCVERFGYKIRHHQVKKELLYNKNIIFIDYRDEYLKHSSAMIRREFNDM